MGQSVYGGTVMRSMYGVCVGSLVSLLWCSTVLASSYVCGDATRLAWYGEGIDPARVPACPAPYVASKLPDNDPAVLAQQAALHKAVKPKYLKVVAERMVEMTQPEKDTVDAPAQVQAAATAVAKNEIAANEVCANNTLPQITAYWKGPGGKQAQLQTAMGTFQAAIAALTAGPAKTALQAAYDALLLHMTQFVDDGERSWRFVCAHGALSPYVKGP